MKEIYMIFLFYVSYFSVNAVDELNVTETDFVAPHWFRCKKNTC